MVIKLLLRLFLGRRENGSYLVLLRPKILKILCVLLDLGHFELLVGHVLAVLGWRPRILVGLQVWLGLPILEWSLARWLNGHELVNGLAFRHRSHILLLGSNLWWLLHSEPVLNLGMPRKALRILRRNICHRLMLSIRRRRLVRRGRSWRLLQNRIVGTE